MNAMANLNECFVCGIPLDFEERANLLAQEFSAALQKNVGKSLEQDEKFWQVMLKSAGQLGEQAIGVATLTALAVTGVVGTFADPSVLSSIEPDLLSAALTKLVPAGQGAVAFWIRDIAGRLARKEIGWSTDEERQDVQRTEITKLIDEIAHGNLLSTEFLIGLSGLVNATSITDQLEASQLDATAVDKLRAFLQKVELLPTMSLAEALAEINNISADATSIRSLFEQSDSSLSSDNAHLQHQISQDPQEFSQNTEAYYSSALEGFRAEPPQHSSHTDTSAAVAPNLQTGNSSHNPNVYEH
jgi:hypothetical protein